MHTCKSAGNLGAQVLHVFSGQSCESHRNTGTEVNEVQVASLVVQVPSLSHSKEYLSRLDSRSPSAVSLLSFTNTLFRPFFLCEARQAALACSFSDVSITYRAPGFFGS